MHDRQANQNSGDPMIMLLIIVIVPFFFFEIKLWKKKCSKSTIMKRRHAADNNGLSKWLYFSALKLVYLRITLSLSSFHDMLVRQDIFSFSFFLLVSKDAVVLRRWESVNEQILGFINWFNKRSECWLRICSEGL